MTSKSKSRLGDRLKGEQATEDDLRMLDEFTSDRDAPAMAAAQDSPVESPPASNTLVNGRAAEPASRVFRRACSETTAFDFTGIGHDLDEEADIFATQEFQQVDAAAGNVLIDRIQH